MFGRILNPKPEISEGVSRHTSGESSDLNPSSVAVALVLRRTGKFQILISQIQNYFLFGTFGSFEFLPAGRQEFRASNFDIRVSQTLKFLGRKIKGK